MTDQAHSEERDERDFAAIWQAVWRGKLVVAGFAAAAALVAIFYLNTATYLYTAQLKVIPAVKESGTNPSSRLGGLAAMAGLGTPTSGDLPFILYKQGLQSRDVAETLDRDPQLMRHIFAGEWDERAGQWVNPQSLRTKFVSSIKRLLGLPVYPWAAPDAARLQQFLQARVAILENPNSPVVTIEYSDPDPVFATAFLSRLSQTVDQTVRRKTIRKTGDYIAYLSQKLTVVTLAEHRASLASTLAEQERQRMTASSSTPFAAEPIDRVVVSTHPTSPQPTLVLGAAILGGLLVGTAIVLVRDHSRQQAAARANRHPAGSPNS